MTGPVALLGLSLPIGEILTHIRLSAFSCQVGKTQQLCSFCCVASADDCGLEDLCSLPAWAAYQKGHGAEPWHGLL